MESEKNDPQGGAPPSAAPGAKRPHAVLDLEATEVPAPVEAAAGAPENEAEQAAAKEDGAAEQPPLDEAEAGGETAPPAREARGRTPFLPAWATHAASGLGGGALAMLLFYAALSPSLERLGQSPGAGLADASNLERRLDTLEQAMPLPASPQLAEKLAAAENRFARIEETQSRLAGETKALAERQGKFDAAGVEARVAKLENQLGTLAASSPDDASAGPVAQLAAIAGKLADIEARAGRNEEAARALAASLDAVKTRADSGEGLIASLRSEGGQTVELARAAKEDAAALRRDVEARAAELNKRLDAAAKPGDIAHAVAPVTEKLAAVERRLADVAGTEEGRRANAERILLTLELAGLKRAIERGEGYARELAEVRATSAGKWDLAALEPSSGHGVSPIAALKAEFRKAEPEILDAAAEPADGSVFGRLVAGAKSIVRVRKIDHPPEDASAEAVVARMKSSIEAGRLDAVIEEAKRLPPAPRAAASPWLEKVAARRAVDAAIANLENQLRASLTGSGASSSSGPE